MLADHSADEIDLEVGPGSDAGKQDRNDSAEKKQARGSRPKAAAEEIEPGSDHREDIFRYGGRGRQRVGLERLEV